MNIKADIREMAKKFKNTYSIGIFFTHRESYRKDRHSGCLSSKAEALSELCLYIAGRLEQMTNSEEKEIAQTLLAEHQAEMEKLKQIEKQPE